MTGKERKDNLLFTEGDGGLSYNPDKGQCSYPTDSRLPFNSSSLSPSNNQSGQCEQNCIQLEQCYYEAGSHQVNKLDTIHLAIPEGIVNKVVRRGKRLGISYMGYDSWRHCYYYEVSAKILKAKYSDLISKYNIRQFIQELNKSRILEVNEDAFYDQVMATFTDFTIDIPRDNKPETFLTLTNAVMSPRWFRQPYQRGEVKESVLFRSKAQHKNSGQFYDKSVELLRPENRELLEHIDLDYFNDKIRCEFRFHCMPGFRAMFGFPPTNQYPLLKDLLESNINVPLTQFRNIIDLKYYQVSPNSEFADIFEKMLQIPDRNKQKELAYFYIYVNKFKENRDDIDSSMRVNSKTLYRDKKKLSKYLPILLQTMKSPTAKEIKSLLRAFGESNGK